MKKITETQKNLKVKLFKKIILASSYLFIVGCSNGEIDISDIENSFVGEYSCQLKGWTLPGNELFPHLYKSGDRNLIRTPYGIAHETIQNYIYNLKGGSNFFEKIPNEIYVSKLDDKGRIVEQYSPTIWKLINNNDGNLHFSAGAPGRWKVDLEGFHFQDFNAKEKFALNLNCRRDHKLQEKTNQLIEKYKKQLQK